MGNFETFMRGVQDGNLKNVEENFQANFLEKTIDDDNFERRPIHWACWRGHLEIVKFLCQQKCNIESEDKSKKRPIHWACMDGNPELVEFLIQCNCELECRDEEGKTPMELARMYRHERCRNIMNEALERKKIFDCVRRNDARAFGALYSPDILMMEQKETGFSILEVVFQSRAYEIINFLINKLVNVEEISTLENHMKKCSRPDAVQLIQEFLLYRSIRLHDADGFHMSCSSKTINEHGKLIKCSFLEIAAIYGCKAFINVLLKKSIYNKEEWTKAKDRANEDGHDEIAEAINDREILLGKRANTNFTWLHSAVCDNDPDMIRYILDKGLVDRISNNQAVGTSLDLARLMSYSKCIDVLEKSNDIN